MVLLAHVRSAFRQSIDTHGSPRMRCERKAEGIAIGSRQTRRMMRENGLEDRQKRQSKRATENLHAFPIAPNLLDQDFAAERRDEKWPVGACVHAPVGLEDADIS